MNKEKKEKEKKKDLEQIAAVYGPPPRPYIPYEHDEIKFNIPPSPSPSFNPPKPTNDLNLSAVVYGPPPRPPKSSDIDLIVPTPPKITPPSFLDPSLTILEPKSQSPRKKEPPK